MLLTVKISTKDLKTKEKENHWLPPDPSLAAPLSSEDNSPWLTLQFLLTEGKCFLIQNQEQFSIEKEETFLVNEQSITVKIEKTGVEKDIPTLNDFYSTVTPSMSVAEMVKPSNKFEQWDPSLKSLSKVDPLDFLNQGLGLSHIFEDAEGHEVFLSMEETNES